MSESLPGGTGATLTGFLDALASNEPAPGGGAAAALAGAAGVSLLMMVARLPKTRTGAADEIAALTEAAAALGPLRGALVALIDRDSAAYRAVLAAWRREKATPAQQQARREAVQQALRGATETPLATLRACRGALACAHIVATHALVSARSDVAVGVELLGAAARGAALNVRTNLPGLTDAGYVEAVRAEQQLLEHECATDAAAALDAVARTAS